MRHSPGSLEDTIREAAARGRRLCIRGGGTKDFYGGALEGEPLELGGYGGIVEYEPTELLVTARAGTLLADLERTLAAQGQMLGFEPPGFAGATLGGAVASGLAGPRRVCCGTVRDFLLGVELIDGRGERLRFGGRVIKNVAGFDVTRLMAGSLGTLGVLTEITLKTLPRPPEELTLRFALGQERALESMNRWAARPLPISATAWHDGQLSVRLSGSAAAVRAARDSLGGELAQQGETYWRRVTEQRLAPFEGCEELWRLALPAGAPVLALPAPVLLEWNGVRRWVPGPLPGFDLRAICAMHGGHATLYRARGKPAEGPFPPLPGPLLALHRRLKSVFDPHGLFNRGRLHPAL